MIKLRNVTLKNFLSIGNQTQAVDLDRKILTLILGENLDLGGDDGGNRNGAGKTSLVNSISYALYGQALTNIKRDNLINKTNGKNMLVTLEFEKDNIVYRIERGRRPNVLKLYVNGEETLDTSTDESQGDSRQTQEFIEKTMGLSHTMFKHIVALNTYTEPFLSMSAHEQRIVIEQLLGITKLSEKADSLKNLIRGTKDLISEETFRIEAIKKSNKTIEDSISNLEMKQRLWERKRNEDIETLNETITELQSVDIDAEIQAHKSLDEYNTKQQNIRSIEKEISNFNSNISETDRALKRLYDQLDLTRDHKCHACGQDLHDQAHEDQLSNITKEISQKENRKAELDGQLTASQNKLAEIGSLGKKPKTRYDNLSDALNHRNSLENAVKKKAEKETETDHYAEQIAELKSTAIQEVNFDTMNEFDKLREHQEFLLKLLTSKDSFVRKRIIDQNLNYLNSRLAYYLDQIGLPHRVIFQNDLTVEITQLGQELDSGNLSRGETTRLILSLSFAFRDVWESLYQNINTIFLDELIDNGLDSSGAENCIAVLKKMSRERQKSIFLISHKDELINRVNTVLKVIKENGFTTFNNDVEIIEHA
jgi:DNA repair exonuclease SbcCD ATPase subunit